MKRWFIGVVVFLVLSASWLGVNFVAFFEGWGADTIAPKDDDAALVTALRETSVFFAALLGVVFLKEGFGPRRAVSAGVLALGLILMQVGGSA